MSDPILIFSTGGRTGSTWVARALTSTGGVLIWPESRLLLAGLEYGSTVNWGSNLPEFRADHSVRACLRPDGPEYLEGLRTLCETTLGGAARREGFLRWGCKELYWRADQVQAAADLWPDGTILILTRRFRETFASAIGLPEFAPPRCKLEWIRAWLAVAREAVRLQSLGVPHRLIRYEDLLADGCRELAHACRLPEPREWPKVFSTATELTAADELLLRPFGAEIAELEAQTCSSLERETRCKSAN
jgi:hypothetical protein